MCSYFIDNLRCGPANIWIYRVEEASEGVDSGEGGEGWRGSELRETVEKQLRGMEGADVEKTSLRDERARGGSVEREGREEIFNIVAGDELIRERDSLLEDIGVWERKMVLEKYIYID